MKNVKKVSVYLIAAAITVFTVSCSKEDLSKMVGSETSAVSDVRHGADDPADVGDDHGDDGTEAGDDHGSGSDDPAGDDHGEHHGGDDTTGHH